MLHRSEFNGKKDVLHFKLLQAAINENNAKKAYEQNMENLNENSNVSKRYGIINKDFNLKAINIITSMMKTTMVMNLESKNQVLIFFLKVEGSNSDMASGSLALL